MFDEFAHEKKSLSSGFIAPILMAAALFCLTLSITGLAVNGYDSLPLIGWVDIRDRPIAKLVNKLFALGYLACFGIGITQLIYVIPAIYLARAKGQSDFIKGLIIGASLVLLLNTTCASYLYLGLWRK